MSRKFKSKEAEENVRKHQFGQPGGNPQGDQSKACGMREFYRWVEHACEEELASYMEDTTKPYVRRRFIKIFTSATTPQDFFDLTNQTHGAPKQVIETVDAPTIIIDLNGDDEKPEPKKRGRKPKAKK